MARTIARNRSREAVDLPECYVEDRYGHHRTIGFDPDVYVVEPAPPEGEEVDWLLLWQPGHHPPSLAIEVVSRDNARKDTFSSPDKCAAAGVGELWVFDRYLAGSRTRGVYRLQVWRRSEGGFERVYAGDGPAYSPYLNAWIFVVDEGTRVRPADDRHASPSSKKRCAGAAANRRDARDERLF